LAGGADDDKDDEGELEEVDELAFQLPEAMTMLQKTIMMMAVAKANQWLDQRSKTSSP
jgi:hypothetical protein